MQSVAREMNLSETAYLLPLDEGFSLRWFTPWIEVDLCGHTTVASAHALWECNRLPLDEPAVFHTRSGVLTAVRKEDWIEVDFPADPPVDADPPQDLSTTLRVDASCIQQVKKGRFAWLAELASEELVRCLKPDLQAIQKMGSMGIIVTSLSGSEEYDFVSRFFAPQSGIPEDPATGAAHCCLGPYWRERLAKDSFSAYQASERGGVIRVEVRGERVTLGGQAVTVARGELAV
jgi:PhzF family phenazine biosynthesis protein